MQTLGLSSKSEPADGLFKRLFWPRIESAYDVDLLGQQGFWLCTAVAALSGLSLLFAGFPTLGLIYILALFLGGCGVRERSVAAATIIFLLYLASLFTRALAGGLGIPLFPVVITMLLFSNIRGTVLSRMWKERPEEADRAELPERSSELWQDRFANILPGKLWPIGQFVFYPMAAIVLLLLLFGVFALERARAHPAAPEASRVPSPATTQTPGGSRQTVTAFAHLPDSLHSKTLRLEPGSGYPHLRSATPPQSPPPPAAPPPPDPVES